MRALPVVAALVGLALLCPTAPYAQAQTTLKLAPAEPLAFARATSPRAFRLPEDHGPHFEFQTEWWYYTGQLATADERRFGFQLTFFRRGLSPGPPPVAGLATNQIYFAHFALTDVGAGRHASAERLSRGAAGLAGASGQPFRVFVEDWTAVATSPHGDRGLSPKSDEPGNASHYVGYTRMSARGRVGTDGTGTPVTGEAWFDHEWSTSALGPLALGWDWFSLQLGEGRELMLFEIRRADGSWEGASGGTLA